MAAPESKRADDGSAEEPEPTAERGTLHVSRRAFLEGVGFAGVLAGIQAWQHRDVPTGAIPELSVIALDSATALPARPRVVHFWATWCGVCRAMHDNLQVLGDDSIQVATRSGSADELRAWLEQHDYSTERIFMDPSGEVARRWGVSAFPSTFFIHEDGQIADSAVGYTTRGGLWLRQLMV